MGMKGSLSRSLPSLVQVRRQVSRDHGRSSARTPTCLAKPRQQPSRQRTTGLERHHSRKCALTTHCANQRPRPALQRRSKPLASERMNYFRDILTTRHQNMASVSDMNLPSARGIQRRSRSSRRVNACRKIFKHSGNTSSETGAVNCHAVMKDSVSEDAKSSSARAWTERSHACRASETPLWRDMHAAVMASDVSVSAFGSAPNSVLPAA